jgi:hypothetical protein
LNDGLVLVKLSSVAEALMADKSHEVPMPMPSSKSVQFA